jgi:hypothetical protein
VREAEGPATLRPGSLLEDARSQGSKNYIRNVEAEGSSPFTSTKSPGHMAKVGSPEGHEALLSATWFVVEVVDASWPRSPKNQVTSGQPDLRHAGTCDWAPRVFTWPYRRSLDLQKPMNSGRVEVAFAITEPAVAVSIDVLPVAGALPGVLALCGFKCGSKNARMRRRASRADPSAARWRLRT